MTQCLYFAYGSNVDPQRMRARQVDFIHSEAGVLEDFTLTFDKRSKKFFDRGFANVKSSVVDHVEGVLYHLSSEKELQKLDKFEGYPVHYDRVKMPIVVKAGIVTADVYIAKEEWITEGLKPTSEYMEHILRGKPIFTEAYFKRLKSIPTTDI